MFGVENLAPYSEIQPLSLKTQFFSSTLLAFNQRNSTEMASSRHFLTVPPLMYRERKRVRRAGNHFLPCFALILKLVWVMCSEYFCKETETICMIHASFN